MHTSVSRVCHFIWQLLLFNTLSEHFPAAFAFVFVTQTQMDEEEELLHSGFWPVSIFTAVGLLMLEEGQESGGVHFSF